MLVGQIASAPGCYLGRRVPPSLICSVNVGSLFSGIGGFDLGFERAGMRTEWFVECDPYCQAVLRKHWPTVPCYEDVRSVAASAVRPVDLLCGGFPCQDLSAAGRGAGLDGARSGLWSEFARLIGELRPRYVVVENVPLLRSRGLGRVLGEMAALGYDAEWDCVPACAVGAPHRRDRVWIVAYPQRSGLEGQRSSQGNRKSPNLGTAVHLWPTPTSSPNSNRTMRRAPSHGAGHGKVLGGEVNEVEAEAGRPRGLLNPTWVEWLMGFPLGWTALDPSETP